MSRVDKQPVDVKVPLIHFSETNLELSGMKLMCLSFLLAVVILQSSSSAQERTRLEWTKERVVGLAMSLEDPTAVAEYRFAKDGIVLAEFGQKNGPVTGPALQWKIIEGRLQIGDGKFIEQFTLISRDKTDIVVKTRSGKTLRFKIIKW